jgi:hypothetical protein
MDQHHIPNAHSMVMVILQLAIGMEEIVIVLVGVLAAPLTLIFFVGVGIEIEHILDSWHHAKLKLLLHVVGRSFSNRTTKGLSSRQSFQKESDSIFHSVLYKLSSHTTTSSMDQHEAR